MANEGLPDDRRNEPGLITPNVRDSQDRRLVEVAHDERRTSLHLSGEQHFWRGRRRPVAERRAQSLNTICGPLPQGQAQTQREAGGLPAVSRTSSSCTSRTVVRHARTKDSDRSPSSATRRGGHRGPARPGPLDLKQRRRYLTDRPRHVVTTWLPIRDHAPHDVTAGRRSVCEVPILLEEKRQAIAGHQRLVRV